MLTDGELVRCVVAGETAAYGELAHRWFSRILAFCQSRLVTGHFQAAEDIAQEVFVRGFVDLASLTNAEQFGPWLRGIARHLCADWGRGWRRVDRQWNDIEWQNVSSLKLPGESVFASDERDIVLQQIATISEELREVVLLHYYEDFTYEEMAEWLGVSRATVNERLAKARSQLRIRLAKLRSDA